MKIVPNLPQGSPEWKEFRKGYFCASDAAAMLGYDPIKQRNQLLHRLSTGIEDDNDKKSYILEKGHRAEAIARPIVQQFFGDDDLYPVVGVDEIDGLPLLASFDGLTMSHDTSWENKITSAARRAMIETGDLNDAHWPQVEQQLLLSGAKRAYFTTCDEEREQVDGQLWYTSRPERRAQLLAGWKQFSADLANYIPPEVIPAGKAEHIDALPILSAQLVGKVESSNLATWKELVTARIAAINTNLVTEDDFATAAKMVNFLDEGEKKLGAFKEHALTQTVSIAELFSTIDDFQKLMREKRLELNKLVEKRKKERKQEIVDSGKKRFDEYIAAQNEKLGTRAKMPAIVTNFPGCIAGKSNFDNIQNAVDTELARYKIEADRWFLQITANLAIFDGMAQAYGILFPDLHTLVTRDADAFRAIVQGRITQHEEELKQRREEEARKELAAQAAQQTAPSPISQPVTPPAGSVTGAAPLSMAAKQEATSTSRSSQGLMTRPTDDQIIGAIAKLYRREESVIVSWLRDMDLTAAAEKRREGVAA